MKTRLMPHRLSSELHKLADSCQAMATSPAIRDTEDAEWLGLMLHLKADIYRGIATAVDKSTLTEGGK